MSNDLVITHARALAVIQTAQEYERAVQLWRDLTALEDQIRESFDEPIKLAHAAHKNMISKRDEHLKPVLEAKSHIKSQQDAFNSRERARRAEEVRLAQEAQAKAIEAARASAAKAELDPFDQCAAVQAAAESVPVPASKPAPIADSYGRRMPDKDAIQKWYSARGQNVMPWPGDMLPGTMAVYRLEITVSDAKSVPDELTTVSTVNKRR